MTSSTVPVATVTASSVRVPKTIGLELVRDAAGQLETEPLRFRVQAIPAAVHEECARLAGDLVDQTQRQLYAATIPPDRERLWDNAVLQRHYGVRDGLELLKTVLQDLGAVVTGAKALAHIEATSLEAMTHHG